MTSVLLLGLLSALVLAVLYCAFHPGQFDISIAMFARILALVSSRARRFSVGREVEARVSRAAKALAGGNRDLLPFRLKIKWVTKENCSAVLKGGTVIVRMQDYTDQAYNMAVATTAFVSNALLRPARSYLERESIEASDLITISEMLWREDRRALRLFFDDILTPRLEGSTTLANRYGAILKIDESGLFFYILLPAFQLIADKYAATGPSGASIEESRQLVDFLYQIASPRERDEHVPLVFNGQELRVSVGLLARREAARAGLAFYVQKSLSAIEEGSDRVFLVGIGLNARYVVEVGTSLRTHEAVASVTYHEYPLPHRPGLRATCAVVVPRSTKPASAPRLRPTGVQVGQFSEVI